MFAQHVSFTAAFTAGILSFLSPCVLPLIPAYFTFITGMSLEDLTAGGDQTVRNKLILSTVAYVLGFSLVFILLGGAVSMMGQQLDAYKEFIRLAGGAVVIVFGAHLAGIVRIPFFDYEKKIHVRNKPLHILGVFLVGMAFGAGWSPCIGPLLGTILAIAATEGSVPHGMTLLSIYSLGMALPFILMSFFINYMLAFIKRASQWIRFVTVAAGVLLIVMGLLLVFDKMNMITAY
ncbi:MAG: cytochrome c biogenesis protein CcdA [Desulfobacteraceae bacterium]|jgi:cytochrome c-type biogenesis protein